MKKISVGFITKELKDAFEKLKEGKFEDKRLYEFILRAKKDLEINPTCAIRIQKKLWPKEYIRDYQVTNLWKYDLPNAWRLVYTIENDEAEIIAIFLEWLTHKEYERRFKY
ncbi:MAG: hypothetical protein AABX11_03635 [Nanoarchaeota archaeon]